MASEKYLERKLGQEVKKLGGWSIKLLPFLVRGLPDRMCLLPGGRLFFAEIKTTGEKPTPVQKMVCRRIERLGFHVVTIDTLEQINQIIKEYEQ